MKFKRLLSILLAVAIVVSGAVITSSLVATGADREIAVTSAYQDMLAKTSAENGYGLASTVNDGTILQAWNWSFASVEAMLPTLAEQGFTTIQVSPPNEIKTGTKGAKVLQSDNLNGWWMFYQPAGFQLNESTDNALGTKAEFVSMCSKAHEYGIKIIVDAVINHMGTKEGDDTNTSTDPMSHVTPRAAQFEPEIYNNKLFHTPWAKMTYKEDPNQYSQYESTYDLTRNCTSGLPDLKTEDSRVQNAIYDYLAELIEAGADGFRFDAAKHIETSDDISGLKSDFWKNTLQKVRTNYPDCEVYAYGEILNNCGVNRPFSMYTKLFDVTDSGSYWGIKDAVTGGGGNATPFYPNSNFTAANTILWDESHDTYMDGATTSLNVVQRGKIWALCAGRATVTTVYFARPDDGTNTNACYNIALGKAKKTAWSNATTKAINQFHNYFIGQSEYCTANENGWAYIERGNSGAIIVHLGGSTSGNVSVTNHKLANGTYKDAITGNTFTVSGGRISGSVGSTGVACIYLDGDAPEIPTDDPDQPTTPVVVDPDGYPYKDGCYTVVFSNSKHWDGDINLYYWATGSEGPIAWPGTAMTYYQTNEYGESQYVGFVPVEFDNVIINNGSVQTVDTPISGHVGLWADAEVDGKWTVGTWQIAVNAPTTPTDPVIDPTDPPEQPTDPPEQPTDAPEDPTEPVVVPDKSTVTVVDWSGATQTREVSVGDVITVTSYLRVPAAKKVNSINVWQEFNIGSDMLQLLNDVDTDDDEIFPNLSGLTANLDGNIIKGNHSVAKYKQAFTFDSENSILIKATYKVVAEGACKVKTDIITLATIDEDQAMVNQIVMSKKVGTDTIRTRTVLTAPGTGNLLGDTDSDGKVDIFDASYIQKALAGTTGYPNYADLASTDQAKKLADIDKDGKVDIFDASLVQKFLAGDQSAKKYGIGEPLAA